MDQNAKQQVVEKLKSATNALVTVSNNPSVDDLSAAIGLSLLLSKLGKHASAVFSGAIPPAIEFLEPGKRFDKDVSGLRDFIIALDKEKADKLRYKVEDNVVKIFITPYRTTITKDDLRFEEGDFNVDAVVALGVSKREDLDGAIKAHGRILHDATVMTINAGSNTSSLGSVDWQDPGAGSLSEMLVSITESFGSGLLDEQISTAFLTGIVAETERFSNPKTTPKVMTMSAQLMAAGANQQLIATNLDLPDKSPPAEPPADESQLTIDHGAQQSRDDQSKTEDKSPVSDKPPHEKTLQELESEISNLSGGQPKTQPGGSQPSSPPSSTPGKPRPITESYGLPTEPTDKSDNDKDRPIKSAKGRGPRDVDADPTLGGTFNATSQQAHDDSVSDLRKNMNATLLSHPGKKPLKAEEEPPEDRPSARARDVQPLNPALSANQNPTANPSPPGQLPPAPVNPSPSVQTPSFQPPQPSQPSPPPTPIADQTADIEAARKAVEEAVNNQPFDSAGHPLKSIGSMPIAQDQAQPGEPNAPNKIEVDSGGNLRVPGAQPPQPNDPHQDFQLPKPPGY